MMRWLCRAFDVMHGPAVFEFVWRIFSRITPLNGAEISQAAMVLGANAIHYDAVRVAEGGILRVIFWFNKNRAFTTFHTINLLKYQRRDIAIVLHELLHVLQYEIMGSIYIPRALQAQRNEGYHYGEWPQLKEDWLKGKHFCDYGFEQQGQIVEDYYNKVIKTGLSPEDPVSLAYQPFIDELKDKKL